MTKIVYQVINNNSTKCLYNKEIKNNKGKNYCSVEAIKQINKVPKWLYGHEWKNLQATHDPNLTTESVSLDL